MVGRHLKAMLDLLATKPKRRRPHALLVKWLAKETRADLRALFTALAAHDPGGASAGDFSYAVGGRVPRTDDPKRDRDDVVCIGVSGGGDLFVVDAPGTSTRSDVTEIVHDEGWTDGTSWDDLDHLFASRIRDYREDGTDEGDIRTDLDRFVAAKESPRAPLASSGPLLLVPAREPRPDDTRSKGLNEALYGLVAWREDHWHGPYAFAETTFNYDKSEVLAAREVTKRRSPSRVVARPSAGEPISVFHATLLDRTKKKIVARIIKPAILAGTVVDAHFDCVIPTRSRATDRGFSSTEEGRSRGRAPTSLGRPPSSRSPARLARRRAFTKDWTTCWRWAGRVTSRS